nr:hypothetical protein [Tanacetum cinerariifolium]
MVIDKSWTLLERHEKAVYTGLMKFVDDCKPLVNSAENVKCPCKSCRRVLWVSIENLPKHITRYGWDPGYKTWVHHSGPDLPQPPPVIDNIRQPQMSDMIALLNDLSNIPLNNKQNKPTQGDIGETSNEPTQAKRNEFEELYAIANEELYPGCDYVTRLDFMAKFTYFKVKGKLTDSIFNEMLKCFQHVFPTMKGYKLPPAYYAIKKTFKTIGLGWKENSTPRKKVPKKRATEKCTDPGKMQHPVDGRAWKNFDTKYPNFAKEPRNVPLRLAADGFNSFSNLSQAYSMWPVILTTYNLPSWLCMKESSFMLTLLIPDPKSPGKDIDVYLRPLIDNLKVLWALKGVETIDVATCHKFNMRAMVLWTINDFSARSSLSGWSGQGYKACLTCNEDTPSIRVLGKTAYVGHRRFLKKPLKWMRSLEFNGEIEDGDPPRKFDRDQIQAQLARLPTEQKKFCQFIKGVKLPDGFGSNFKHKVTDNDTNIIGMKFHDYHIMMQRLLPYGLQQYLPDEVAKPTIELCSFFKQICSATLMEDDMLKAKRKRLLKACLFAYNRCFHLKVHEEAKSRDKRCTTQNSGICSPSVKDGEMYYEEDPDVIYFDNSSDLPLSTSLNDLDNATLHIDGQSTEVDAPSDIIDLDEDNNIINDEDALPHDLADSDVEDLVNVDDDDGVDVVYSSEEEE